MDPSACSCVITAATALFEAPPGGCEAVPDAVPAVADGERGRGRPHVCGARCACAPGHVLRIVDGKPACISEEWAYLQTPEMQQVFHEHIAPLLSDGDKNAADTAMLGRVLLWAPPIRVVVAPEKPFADVLTDIHNRALQTEAALARGIIIDGDVTIATPADVTALRAPGDVVNAIRAVTGTISITGVHCNLDGIFGDLREAGDVIIEDASITSMSGAFRNLLKAGHVHIANNDTIEYMDDLFRALREATTVTIADNNDITGMWFAFGALKVVDELNIDANERLNSLDGDVFPALEAANVIRITGNISLEYMEGAFSALKTANTIRIAANWIPPSLNGAFSALETVKEKLVIDGNAGLTALNGGEFVALKAAKEIEIYGNDTLTSLRGAFGALETVTDEIRIMWNASLAYPDEDERPFVNLTSFRQFTFWDNENVYDNITIRGNLALLESAFLGDEE